MHPHSASLFMHSHVQDGMGVRTFPVVRGSQVSETPENHTRNDGYPCNKRIYLVAKEDNIYVFGRPWGYTR